MKNTSLLLVDLPKSCSEECPEQWDAVERVIRQAKEVAMEIIGTEMSTCEFSGAIRSQCNDVLWKPEYDSFIGTGLDIRLRKTKTDTVIVGGYKGDVCALATMKGATEKGLQVVTSPSILFFRNNVGRSETEYRGRMKQTLDYCKEETCYMETVDELLEYMRTYRAPVLSFGS